MIFGQFLQERVERIREADENTSSIGADSISGKLSVEASNNNASEDKTK